MVEVLEMEKTGPQWAMLLEHRENQANEEGELRLTYQTEKRRNVKQFFLLEQAKMSFVWWGELTCGTPENLPLADGGQGLEWQSGIGTCSYNNLNMKFGEKNLSFSLIFNIYVCV